MKKIIFLIVFCIYLQPVYAVPQRNALNYSTGYGSPITTTTTDTLKKGAWSMNQRAEYYRARPFSNQTLEAFPLSESVDDLLVNYFLVGYGWTDSFSIGVNLPLVYASNFRTLGFGDDFFPKVTKLGNVSGLSDTTLFGFWRINNEDNKNFPLSTALLFGLNTPTGKTTAKTRQGDLFPAADQPGTGTWSPFMGILFSKYLGELSLSSNFVYTQSTKGIQDTTLGSYFDYNFGAVYPLFEHKKEEGLNYTLAGIFEITGEYVFKNKVLGFKDPNSGGNSVYWAPGLRLNFGEDISTYLGCGFPLTETFYGKQVKSNYAIYSGIDITF